MRDRLCELRRISSEASDREEAFGCRGDDESQVHRDQDLEKVFKEVQSMRQEIAALRMDVKRLAKQSGRFLTSVRRISSIKRGSNAIAQDVRVRAEGLRRRLRRLRSLTAELEEQHGAERAVVRIARAQYVSIAGGLRDAVLECDRAEAAQRDNCKRRIQRQAGILGRSLSNRQLDEMIETGRWNMFAQGLGMSRSTLSRMEERRQELLALETCVRDVHELFQLVAQLVEEQGGTLDSIEANVLATCDYLGSGNTGIKRAVRYKRKNPWRRMFRPCSSFHGCMNQ
ncbi:syntaxin-11-like [Scleropages formosus]|uniref:Syntaxin 11 n=1 Tax=Scleropages formosus TaxID=113540 RepID=A0A0P7UVH4_SCLFO|nr:syntaxin-11-like [Scleropages formosus]KPP73983.1 syntaxin-11-like [Scleropages formosus]